MDQVWPQALINGAVVILLWGLVWRSNNQRVDAIESGVKTRVKKDYCALKHQGIHEDVQDIKRVQELMAKTLEEINMVLAREYGWRRAQSEFGAKAGREKTNGKGASGNEID